ncbi:uncharacterized protein LOC123562572 [Mercenaria mercenaria]|uniref:uncharacterized protein LOC123562572 n=1 Tax=Mercenaria mercenaria TaxID=6596 RepID=UPI001E1D687E|nr:uncharacterized protein LOC123562572 [Mercenaria mercenaria]
MIVLILLNVLLLANSVHGSRKKGVAAYPGNLLCDDFKVLNNMSWWYDWHMDMSFFNTKVASVCPPSTNQTMPPHIPMVKKYNNHTVLNIPADARYVLGFNEPNHAAQAGMTPQQAADAWPEIEKHSHGKPLVSPATAGMAFHWYDEFFRLCHNCRIDYIAAHLYSCNAHDIMSYLQKLHQKYHKKVWLTEFACPNSKSEQEQLHLMQTLLPQLEAAKYVYRYAWFSARRLKNSRVNSMASLLHANSSTLTTIGHFYNNFQANGHNAHIVG